MLFVERAFTSVVGIALLLAGAGLVAIAATYLAGAAVALLYISGALVARGIRPRFDLSARHIRRLLLASLPIGLATIFDTVVFRIDATILSFFKGNTAVGLYGVAYQLLESTLFLSYAFVGAITPTLSRLGSATRPSIGEA